MSDVLRIAFIGQRGVPATYGGIERHVEEIGSRLVERGNEVTVYCRTNYTDRRDPVYRGMRVVYQTPIGGKHLEAFSHSGQATIASIGKGFDVLHFHAIGPGIFTPVARGLTRAKVVQTIHGLDHERAKWGRLASTLMRTAAWTSGHVPDATIVVGRSLGDDYRARYDRDTTYITNGAPEAVLRPAELITERWGLTPGSYALIVGRLVPEKACDVLLEAFAQVPGGARLVVAGGSSNTDDYVARLEALANRDPRIIMAGYVYGAELEELYSNAAVFVLPSLLECLPLTLLEAASYQRPIIASSIPPHLEVIAESGPGHRLVPPGDVSALAKAIETALAGGEDEKAGALALSDRVVADYSWDRAAEETEALYRRLLRGR